MAFREWLESQRWYWFTLTFDFTPFPWHWQKEFTNYGWGIRAIFGPIGVMVLWPRTVRNHSNISSLL